MIGQSNVVTILIPHRQSTPDRENNLITVLDYYKRLLPAAKVLVIEEDTEKKFSNKYAETIFAYNKGSFSRSWAFNVGAKIATTPVIICVDSDIIVPEEALLVAITGIMRKDFDFCTPYGVFYDLNPEGTIKFKETRMIDSGCISNRYAPGHPNQYGGITIFNRELFLKFGGFNEEIRSWGGEDETVVFTLRKLIVFKKLQQYNLYHLYHNKTSDCTPDNPFYKNNCRIMEMVYNMSSEDIQKYVDTYKDSIGDPNKYKDEL